MNEENKQSLIKKIKYPDQRAGLEGLVHGDITRIATRLNLSVCHVSNILNGKVKDHREVVTVAKSYAAKNRRRIESILAD